MGAAEQMHGLIKQVATQAVSAGYPFSFHFGVVTSINPLKIRVGDANSKQELGEKQLILTNSVQDHYVWLRAHDNTADGDSEGSGYHDQVTTKQNQSHIHKFPHAHMVTVAPPATGSTTSTIPDGTNSQSEKTDHDHNYHYRGGVFKAEYGLKKDEKVLLFRAQGGQSFIVFDRVEPMRGTEGSEDENESDAYNPGANGDREGYA